MIIITKNLFEQNIVIEFFSIKKNQPFIYSKKRSEFVAEIHKGFLMTNDGRDLDKFCPLETSIYTFNEFLVGFYKRCKRSTKYKNKYNNIFEKINEKDKYNKMFR